jgi:hypothetical protein
MVDGNSTIESTTRFPCKLPRILIKSGEFSTSNVLKALDL